jgi:DNA-binding MarR family transcriptional regulator
MPIQAAARLSGTVRRGDHHYEADLGEILTLMRLLWSVDHALQAASKRMARTHGVTGPQRLAIRIVGHYPGISAGELARILYVHPSTLTGILRRLETRGILARDTHAADRRRAVLALTPKGRRLNELKTGTVEAAVRRAVGRTPPRALLAGRQFLRTLESELLR